MKTVTFAELKPGMLLYPKLDVKRDVARIPELYLLITEAHPGDSTPFYGNRNAISYIPGDMAHSGVCSRTVHEIETWELVEDKAVIDNILRARFLCDIKKQQKHLKECVELINGCL